MRILILGGTGFIGREVVRALDDHDVALFHRADPGETSGTARHILGDRGNLAASLPAFKAFAPDVVLDMSPQNARDARRTVAAFRGLAGRAVAVSSLSVYQAFGRLMGVETCDIRTVPLDEQSPLRTTLFPYRGAIPRDPRDPKAWLDDYDKIPAERIVLASPDLPASVVRLPMVYGPQDGDERVGAYVSRLRDGPPLRLNPLAAQWRNARNFVRNIAHSIALVTLNGAAGGVYNAPGPYDFTEIEWVRRIARAAGLAAAVETSPHGGEGPMIDEFPAHADWRQHLRIDDGRIRRELGYREVVSFEDGLAETLESVRTGGCRP